MDMVRILSASFFMGLMQLGVLALLGLSIAALIKYLRKK